MLIIPYVFLFFTSIIRFNAASYNTSSTDCRHWSQIWFRIMMELFRSSSFVFCVWQSLIYIHGLCSCPVARSFSPREKHFFFYVFPEILHRKMDSRSGNQASCVRALNIVFFNCRTLFKLRYIDTIDSPSTDDTTSMNSCLKLMRSKAKSLFLFCKTSSSYLSD